MKCMCVFIGGSNLRQGCTTSSMDRKGCDKLICTSCDLRVQRFTNAVWSEEVNYLFFRNNYSRSGNLREKLLPRDGYCAYTCMCEWRSVNYERELVNDKWVCSGH